jgi:hypothetical protein
VREFNQYLDWEPFAWAFFHTRFEALDAAAQGFAELPAARRRATHGSGGRSEVKAA